MFGLDSCGKKITIKRGCLFGVGTESSQLGRAESTQPSQLGDLLWQGFDNDNDLDPEWILV